MADKEKNTHPLGGDAVPDDADAASSDALFEAFRLAEEGRPTGAPGEAGEDEELLPIEEGFDADEIAAANAFEFAEEDGAESDESLLNLLGEFLTDDEADTADPTEDTDDTTGMLDEQTLQEMAAQLEGSAGPASPEQGMESTTDAATDALPEMPDGVFGSDADTTPIDQRELDTPLVEDGTPGAPPRDAMDPGLPPAPPPKPPPAGPPQNFDSPEEKVEQALETSAAETDAIPQDVLDALLGAAGESAPPEIGLENLAAAASTEPASAPAMEDDLDPLFERGELSGGPADYPDDDDDQGDVDAYESAPLWEGIPVARAKPRAEIGAFFRDNGARITASLAAGMLVGLSTFLVLNTVRQRHVDPAELARGHISELNLAVVEAREMMRRDAYLRAATVLEGPLSRAVQSARRDDAEFLFLEARFKGLQPEFGTPNFDELVREIDTLVDRVPNHPRASEALYWKAKLYEASDLNRAANDVYTAIIDNYSDMPAFDVILIEAAKLSLKIREPRQAAAYMQRLLLNFPGTANAGEARILLADAYAEAGMYDDARTLYVRTAQSGQDPATRNTAIARLGTLAHSQGNFAAAERELTQYLRTATTTEGSDEVYLLLAQTQRQLGKLDAARDTLLDLLNFLPESDATPRAYVAITDVYEALGERKHALRMAQQGAVIFPDNPETLENKGRMLGLSGNPGGAAEALISADLNGANDPQLLLTAARHFVTAGQSGQALKAYARVRTEFPRLDEAFTADVEAAQLRYRLTEVGEAVAALEDLAASTTVKQQKILALEALTDIYSDMELSERLKQTAVALAARADDPDALAKAAEGLFRAGDVALGREVMDRIALGQLTEKQAFSLLHRYGESLLQIDPQRGLDQMEQAHAAYPNQATIGYDERLLQAYLAADRPAAARRMVMEIESHVRENPIDTTYLVEAGIAWGDYLYAKADYRMAADAYSMAIDAAGPMSEGAMTDRAIDPSWAQYQRANALFELEDFAASLTLLDEIAASNAPWAQEAAVKAEYARIEQRLRGAPVAARGSQG